MHTGVNIVVLPSILVYNTHILDNQVGPTLSMYLFMFFTVTLHAAK